MTTEQLESTVSLVTKSDNPFMVLFTLSFICGVGLIIWMARFFNKLNTQNQETIKQNDQCTKELRKSHRDEVRENNRRFDKLMENFDNREAKLMQNLQENTKELSKISATLEKVQDQFLKLEEKVTDKFEYLDDELNNVKSQLSSKGDHHE